MANPQEHPHEKSTRINITGNKLLGISQKVMNTLEGSKKFRMKHADAATLQIPDGKETLTLDSERFYRLADSPSIFEKQSKCTPDYSTCIWLEDVIVITRKRHELCEVVENFGNFWTDKKRWENAREKTKLF